MAITPIVIEDIAPVSGRAQAFIIDGLLQTRAIAGTDASGRAAPDLDAQLKTAFGALERILAAAGMTWSDTLRLACYFDPGAGDVAKRLAQLAPSRLKEACVTHVPLTPPYDGVMVQLELTAAAQARSLASVPGIAASRTANAIFMSGQAGYGDDLNEATAKIYTAFDALLTKEDFAWRDLTRVRQYISDPAADFDLVRLGRERFVPRGEFLSTSVATIGNGPSSRHDITVELQADLGPKHVTQSRDVEEMPGTAHGLRRGNLIHFQAQIANAGEHIKGGDDIDIQTGFVLHKLGKQLEAASCSWSDVIINKVFLKRAADLPRVRAIEAELFDRDILASYHGSRFFHDEALIEIEIAAYRPG